MFVTCKRCFLSPWKQQGLLVGEDRKPGVRLWVRGRGGFPTAHWTPLLTAVPNHSRNSVKRWTPRDNWGKYGKPFLGVFLGLWISFLKSLEQIYALGPSGLLFSLIFDRLTRKESWLCASSRVVIGSHGGTQREKDNFSSMKSILVLLLISWIGGEEPRYKSAGNYNFKPYHN